jgi:hypothetical protein
MYSCLMPDSVICEWENAGWLMADLEIVADPGNGRKFWNFFKKIIHKNQQKG